MSTKKGNPTPEKKTQGMRRFSWRVCETVREKGTTSYNGVAEELVRDLTEKNQRGEKPEHGYDEKNIRRRVYDVLNVFKALNIITQEEKKIHWQGLPTNSEEEVNNLKLRIQDAEEKIRDKKRAINALCVQILTFKNLVARNKKRQLEGSQQADRLRLPFLLLKTRSDTEVDIFVSPERDSYLIQLDQPFVFHDEIEIMKRMGLDFGLSAPGKSTPEQISGAEANVPDNLRQYIKMISAQQDETKQEDYEEQDGNVKREVDGEEERTTKRQKVA
eukprot:Clim_evm47s136 gene=Clim_evmTU47s136